LKIIFQQQGSIKVLGINVVSLESLLLIRIIMSVSFAILFIFLGFIFNRNLLIFGTVVSVIFYFLPLEILKGKLSLKSKKVLRELPDFIDILASLIKAGLTYNDSIIYITKNIGSEISSLFSIYHRKILEGYTKAEAFGIIGKMSFCSEFKSLVKVLHQSEIIGNPIKDVLKDLSRVYRNNQRDFLKIRAERLESNLIIVIFIFIFIPMLALFLIPIIPQLKLLLG
jgi:tight adherence protein C